MFGGRYHIGFVAINAASSVSALTVIHPAEYRMRTLYLTVRMVFERVPQGNMHSIFSRRLDGMINQIKLMADPIKDTDVPAAAPAPVDAPPADAPSAEAPAAEDGKQEEGAAPVVPEVKADEGDDKGNDVATRRHNQQNAATRIATKETAPAPTDAGGEEGDATDLQKVQKELTDMRTRDEGREDEAEMDEIIKANPDMAKYKDEVKKLSTDPSRKQVPIKSLFYEAAGDDLIKIGANRASEANADAAETQQNGTSTGNSPDGSSVSDMSNDDFSKMQEGVRNKQ